MTLVQDYLNEVKARIAASPLVASAELVAERILSDRGYVRLRLVLINGDLPELSEYFALKAGSLSTLEYRYQWMDGLRVHLKKRWDNARRYADLPNHPHHIHDGSDAHILPGRH